ncbi:MAG: MBL fold metallo-hydrolase [Candidatus Levybacteria bacterium]|nr:MBL fold metallo-hydrolase [Candidatus Levybacteria bacterium]
MKKLILTFSGASIGLVILIFFVFSRFNDARLHIVICDVGQGDAIFIRTASQTDILIDGGPDKKVLDCLSRHMPFWDRTLDLVIMTHPDADHSTGLVDVVKRYKVNSFYTEEVPGRTQIFKLLETVLAEQKLSAKFLYTGDKFNDQNGFSMITLWPSTEAIESVDQNSTNLRLNELSVIVLVSYGDFRALLTGDAGSAVMDQIAGQAGSINILKVPHHGSKTGMSDEFLNLTDPEIAVISVGTKNRYGHPSPFSLGLLEKHRIKVLRTDLDGEIEIISDGLRYSVKAEK